MKFKNRDNISYKIGNKIVWESRSCGVSGVIIINVLDRETPNKIYVLASKRGPNAADFQGKWNLIAGYLDWDESGPEAIIRETWEEVGLNLYRLIDDALLVHRNDLNHPWSVETDPSANRQNISIRYGLYITLKWFPSLNTKNNEVDGEVSELMWISINKIDSYDWAFNHDQVIKNYLKINKIKLS